MADIDGESIQTDEQFPTTEHSRLNTSQQNNSVIESASVPQLPSLHNLRKPTKIRKIVLPRKKENNKSDYKKYLNDESDNSESN